MPAVDQRGAALDLACNIGDDWSLSVTVTENSVTWSATGATVASTIINAQTGAAAAVTSFTCAVSDGVLSASLTDVQTIILGAGTYRYAIEVTKASVTRTWLAGSFTVSGATTPGRTSSSASLSITNGTVTLATTTLVAPLAANITVADTGNYYASSTVEAALAEIVNLASESQLMPPDLHQSIAHLDICPPELCSSTITLPQQRMVMIRFTVNRRITVNTAQMGGDNAVSATVTTCRLGLGSVSDDGWFFPLARSANDTTLFQAAATMQSKAFDTTSGYPAAVTLVPGRTYAGVVIIDATTLPTVAASIALRTVMQNHVRARRSGVATDILGSVDPTNSTSIAQIPFFRYLVGGTANTARSAVLLGDSFFASYSSWFGFGNAQGGARLHAIRNKGTGGETLAQMYARWSTDVAAYNPEWCVLHGGTNDIFAEGASSDTVISRFASFITTAQAAGIKLLICTPPTNSAASAGQKTILSAVRSYLLALNATGVKVSDTGIALSTGDGVTSNGSLLVDTVHPNASGITALANAFDDTVSTIT
jgi:lysophospholipase L1-like esterase